MKRAQKLLIKLMKERWFEQIMINVYIHLTATWHE